MTADRTALPDSVERVIAILARDIHYAIADDGLAPLAPGDYNAMRESILRVLTADRLQSLRPAGEDFHDTLHCARVVLHLDPNSDAETGNEVELSVGMTAGPDDNLTIYCHAKDESKLYTTPAGSPSSAALVDAVLVRQAVARGWCAPENSHKEMDVDLAHAIAREILALTAAEAQGGVA